MANSLKELQDKFQQSILEGNDAILDDICVNKKETKATLLNVYQHAYGARLIEFLQNDYPMTLLYLGDDVFSDAGVAYYKNNPSDNPNARWFGRHFAHFLKTTPAFQTMPEVGELAELELALNTAFDAKNAPVLTQAYLTEIAAHDWPLLTFTPHPSTSRLQMTTNASAIWTALSNEETPREAQVTPDPTQLIVWRGEEMARYRPLSYDEAMIWDEAKKGANFGTLCEMLATYWPEEEAPLKAANYLLAWLEAELLTSS